MQAHNRNGGRARHGLTLRTRLKPHDCWNGGRASHGLLWPLLKYHPRSRGGVAYGFLMPRRLKSHGSHWGGVAHDPLIIAQVNDRRGVAHRPLVKPHVRHWGRVAPGLLMLPVPGIGNGHRATLPPVVVVIQPHSVHILLWFLRRYNSSGIVYVRARVKARHLGFLNYTVSSAGRRVRERRQTTALLICNKIRCSRDVRH